MSALYDIIWLFDGIMGIFFKAVVSMLVLTFLCKPKEIDNVIKEIKEFK